MAKRAKVLLRKWREQVLPSANSTPSQPTHADTAPAVLNGAKPQSPAASNFMPQSPALKGLIKPQSPFIKVYNKFYLYYILCKKGKYQILLF